MGALETPCLVYRGPLDQDGYGLIYRGLRRPKGKGRRAVRLHRWIVEQVDGPLLPGEVVMHRCDNPPCFRYDHLVAASQAANLADARIKGRSHEPPPAPGTANPNALLTDEAVRAIRQLRGTASSRLIGERFGVTGATVRAVWLGRRWRHVQ